MNDEPIMRSRPLVHQLNASRLIQLALGVILLAGCANSPSATGRPTCSGTPYAADKVGAEVRPHPRGDATVAGESFVLLTEGEGTQSESQKSRTVIVSIERQTMFVIWVYTGSQIPAAPSVEGVPGLVVKRSAAGEPPMLEITREVLVPPGDMARLVCAANVFWASKKTNFQRDSYRFSNLMVTQETTVKQVMGEGVLRDDASVLVSLIWEISPETLADQAKR